MSGLSSEQLHKSTLAVYMSLMEQFNPGLQKLVDLGTSYVQAFQALAACSEAYFTALAKMGDQALHSLSSHSLGEVMLQISETQRRLSAEMEGVFRWFQVEVLQSMQKNVKLDEEYIAGSRRIYEVEVRNQAKALEKDLRRGAFRDSLEKSDYMQFLKQSQQEILKEEERRYRFVAEKHCALTQSLLFLMMKTGSSLHQKADGWKQMVNDSKNSRPRTPVIVDQEAQLQSSVSSLLQTVSRDEDMSWAKREQEALGRVPSRAPSPVPTRARSSSVGESLGLATGRTMTAVVSHPSSSNPKLLPFTKGEVITVLVEEPRNGWLYGRVDSSLSQGWFPAAYVATEDVSNTLSSNTSVRRHSINNLLDPSDALVVEPKRRTPDELLQPPSSEVRPAPLLERKSDAAETSRSTPVTSESPALAPPQSLKSASSQPHTKSEATSELQTLSPLGAENPLFPRGTNPFATVKLKPTTTNDRSAPRIH